MSLLSHLSFHFVGLREGAPEEVDRVQPPRQVHPAHLPPPSHIQIFNHRHPPIERGYPSSCYDDPTPSPGDAPSQPHGIGIPIGHPLHPDHHPTHPCSTNIIPPHQWHRKENDTQHLPPPGPKSGSRGRPEPASHPPAGGPRIREHLHPPPQPHTLSPGMKLDAHENSAHPATPQKGIAALGDFFFFCERGEDGRRGAAPPATTTATRSGCRKKRKNQKKRKRAQGLPVSAAGSEMHARSSPPPRYGQAVVSGDGTLKTQLRREWKHSSGCIAFLLTKPSGRALLLSWQSMLN